jgi:large subunit ribosomal protein L7/L12
MSEKIEKLLDEISALTLVEASELKKALEDKFGVTAAAPMMMGGMMPGAAAAEAAPAVEEQTEFSVELTDIGPNKLNVIKVVREITQLGLKDAKDLVEAAPKMVKESVSKAEAEDLKKKIDETGAKVTLK